MIIPYQFQYLEIRFCKYDKKLHSRLRIAKFLGKFLYLPVCTTQLIIANIADRHTQEYPVTIEPKGSQIFVISNKSLLTNAVSNFNQFQRYFMRWKVMTSDRVFKGKISKALKHDITSIIKPTNHQKK